MFPHGQEIWTFSPIPTSGHVIVIDVPENSSNVSERHPSVKNYDGQ